MTDLKSNWADGEQFFASDANNVATKVNTHTADIAAAYVKPGGGIPATDLATGVQSELTAAGTAYQKPGAGIPSTDLTAGVQTSLGKADSAVQAAAMTAAITAAINGLVNGAPGALDTLKELADALNDDASFAATINTALAARALASRTITTGTGLTGGGDLTANRTLALTSAVQTSLGKADSSLQTAVDNGDGTATIS